MSVELISLETIRDIAHHYGYWAIFLGISLENAGIPLPGETITLVGGFLAGSGELDYWMVLGSATGGAILGDNCGYWIGRQGGWPFLLWVSRCFRIQESYLLNLKEKFSQNAAKAVFLGRFVALLRIFAGPLAGTAKMPYQKFLFYNSAGALVWAATVVSLSRFVGQVVSLTTLAAWMAELGVVVLLVLVAWIAIVRWLDSRQVRPPIAIAQPKTSLKLPPPD